MTSSSGNSSKSSSLWIHCNRCFENYTQKQRKLFILSCYDVVCENCVTRVNQIEFKCLVCEKLVKGYPIGNTLPPNLKELFHPRPWTFEFQKAWAIEKFQRKQRDKFLLGCRRMVYLALSIDGEDLWKGFLQDVYNKSKEEEKDRLKEECRQAYNFQQKLRRERKHLENTLKTFMQKKVPVRRSSRRNEHFIHPTYTAPSNDLTFDFPTDSHLSKSFML